VATTAAETYLQHAVPGQPGLDLEEGLLHVGRLVQLIRNANDIEFDLSFNEHCPLREIELAGLNTEISIEVENLPDPDLLNDITLKCAPDTFLEVLMGNIRNTIVSFQAWINKAKGAKVCALSRLLSQLKLNFQDNCDEIFRLEAELGALRDADLVEKIKEIKIFENLHNEKPSPLFLNLIRCSGKDDLSCIRGDDGMHFASEKERESHIVNFYEKLYKVPKESKNVNFINCIKNFLGPEILANPIVTGSKLTDAERDRLDRPLTLHELDESIRMSNKKSASGQDGYSNKLISKCSKFFRYPLLNYANHCFSTGTLTHNFRSACIKLIPKKGDTCNLKNWRPISLLSNMYKIISRAINERLKQVVNRICSRAQKGYNSKRYVQEVLRNMCNTVSYCKANNIRGSVLAVDMAKAFDTLLHPFIHQVYKFFGFGDNTIKWLTLLGNNREACIILSKEKKTLAISGWIPADRKEITFLLLLSTFVNKLVFLS
jgi:hypothetical protein